MKYAFVIARVLLGLGPKPVKPGAADPMILRGLPARLPGGDYALAASDGLFDPQLSALAWAFGAYAFDRYKPSKDRPRPRLVAPAGCDLTETVLLINPINLNLKICLDS